MAEKRDAGEYLEKHNVYHLFENLMQQLIIHKPSDPVQFLINQLTTPSPLKLIILGAPASGKGTQCEHITTRWSLVHVSTGDILREEVKKGSEIGLSVKKYLDNGALVPDELIIGVVLNKLNSPECVKSGWLLDGFPRTKAQALALQSAGIFADKVILLDVPDNILVERVEGRRTDPTTGHIYHLKFNPPPADVISRLEQRSDDTAEKVKARLASYNSNLRGIRECFAPIIGVVNAHQVPDKVFADVVEFIDKVPAHGPRRPLRICFIGGPGSGKRTQAEITCEKHGFIHISIKKLLNDSASHQGPAGKKVVSPRLQSLMGKFEDKNKAVIPLLKERLNEMDCIMNGWVIDGYPFTVEQARELEKNGLGPSKVIFLDIDDSKAKERIESRRVDPKTGLLYNITKQPGPGDEIVKRLERHPDDEEKSLDSHLKEYKDHSEELKKFYPNGKRIDASRSEHTIQELVEDFIRG